MRTSLTSTTGTLTETGLRANAMKTFALFLDTELAEIVGCYLPYLWLKQGRSVWLLVPAAASLALFAWLRTLHETAAGCVYAAYGGVYVAVALTGMGIIMFQPR